jgi:spermidine synthase
MQYFFTVFISAFLVFQIQPIVSKIILPWFGGGAGVWTSCLLFFQFFLLVGYFYAYLLSKVTQLKVQVLIHFTLLLGSLIMLPLDLVPVHTLNFTPTLDILLVLMFGVGFPFFILSATSPLLQSWFTHSQQKANPYLLYAMSNFGSFLALISYPVLFEPLLSLKLQTFSWTAGYVTFVCLIGFISLKLIRGPKSIVNGDKSIESPSITKSSFSHIILWFLLSALGVVILVSTTNAMSQNIPPVPFLWIAPLAIYLATYIFAFGTWQIYKRKVWLGIYSITAFLALFIYFIGGQFDIVTQVVIYLFILLTASMICHGELSGLKPEVNNATFFYLIVSLGGVFGSFLVSVVAQISFNEFLEFPIAIFFVFLLIGFSILGQTQNFSDIQANKNKKVLYRNLLLPGISFSIGLIWLIAFFSMNSLYQQYDIDKERNFYGILSVKDIVQGNINERRLVDGSTAHGGQSLVDTNHDVPLSYYRPTTGIEMLLTEMSKSQAEQKLDVGIIGLGVGALAAYGKAGAVYTFYELNPAVKDFANKYFDFLKNSEAKTEIKLGDARVTLQRELDARQANQFNVLVVDAFSGDVIPTHLLTRQAFELYQQHLAIGGVIILHISNRHLSLLPVALGNAQSLSMQTLFFSTSGGGTEHETEWVVLTNNEQVLNNPKLVAAQTSLSNVQHEIVNWTDERIDLTFSQLMEKETKRLEADTPSYS